MIFENPGGPPRPPRLKSKRGGRKGTRRNLRNPFTATAQTTARRTWTERFLRLGAPSGLGMPGGTAVAVGGAGAHGAWGSVSGRIFRCAVFARRTSSRPATGRDGLRSFDSREKNTYHGSLGKKPVQWDSTQGRTGMAVARIQNRRRWVRGATGGCPPGLCKRGGAPPGPRKKDPGRHTEKHIKTCLYLQLS